MAHHFKTTYPWVKLPAIINGPMLNVAGPELVTEVTRANGLGFMAAGKDVSSAHANLVKARESLSKLDLTSDHLPIGLGVQCFTMAVGDFVSLVEKHRPIAIWLFAAHNHKDDYSEWTKAIRKVSDTRVWIQINCVADALMLAEHVKPDVLVMQGADAGGHGAAKAAGVISLVPETVDALTEAGYDIPVIAAGGIVEGRGVAAAVALGAVGVTMGTAFLGSREAKMNASYQKAILEARDGGQSTFKDQVYDNVAGLDWPQTYDARGLRNATTKDHDSGVSIEDNQKAFQEAAKSNAGYGESIQDSRANAWAGTGVGLVKSVKGAYDIVVGSREQALEILKRSAGL